MGERHERDPRSYAQVVMKGAPHVELAPQAVWLPDPQRRALLAHEVGHRLRPGSEQDADDAAAEVLGVQIDYDPRWPGKGLQVQTNGECYPLQRNPWAGAVPYVSPRERALTEEEAWRREVAIWLKTGDPEAIAVAAAAMAPLVPSGAQLVPIPSSQPGGFGGNLALAQALAARTGGVVRTLVGRRAPVPSSRTSRRAGGQGLPAAVHAASMERLGFPDPGRPLVLVDNVVVSGATFEGAAQVLGRPDALGVAYAQQSIQNPFDVAVGFTAPHGELVDDPFPVERWAADVCLTRVLLAMDDARGRKSVAEIARETPDCGPSATRTAIHELEAVNYVRRWYSRAGFDTRAVMYQITELGADVAAWIRFVREHELGLKISADVSFEFGPEGEVVYETSQGELGEIEIEAYDPGAGLRVGRLVMLPSAQDLEGDRRAWRGLEDFAPVLQARVHPMYRRQGVGTRLYELAAHEADKLGLPLASPDDRTWSGSRFWGKLRKRGLADLVRGKPFGSRYVLSYPPPETLENPMLLYNRPGAAMLRATAHPMITEADYPVIFADRDLDTIMDVDDPYPLVPGTTPIEEVRLADEIRALIDIRNSFDGMRADLVERLRTFSPDGEILSRTKTPFSIINKLRRKRLTGAKGITDMVGAMLIVNDRVELDAVVAAILSGALGPVLEHEDFYASPLGGYRAHHFILEVEGLPAELQVKTKRVKVIAAAGHTPYKQGRLNADAMLELTALADLADQGDPSAAAEVDPLLLDKAALQQVLTLQENPPPLPGDLEKRLYRRPVPPGWDMVDVGPRLIGAQGPGGYVFVTLEDWGHPNPRAYWVVRIAQRPGQGGPIVYRQPFWTLGAEIGAAEAFYDTMRYGPDYVRAKFAGFDPEAPPRFNPPEVHPLAYAMRDRYRDDLAAGHLDAAEYWRGQAAAYFTQNPSLSRAQRLALHEVAEVTANGWQSADWIGVHPSTLGVLVKRGLVSVMGTRKGGRAAGYGTRRGARLYRITQAGLDELAATNPLPSPSPHETERQFMARCMRWMYDTDEEERFPAPGQPQAVCYSQYRA